MPDITQKSQQAIQMAAFACAILFNGAKMMKDVPLRPANLYPKTLLSPSERPEEPDPVEKAQHKLVYPIGPAFSWCWP